MTPQQEELVERLHAALVDENVTRVVAMFGGRAFMVNEKMLVCAFKDGSLLVRVSAERDGELLAQPDVSRPEMGAGRSMGTGWLSVSPDALVEDERLRFWLDVALEHNLAVTESAP